MWFGKKSVDELREGLILDERYELQRRIASTFFSDVFEGTHRRTKQRVAIKILRLDNLPKEERQSMQARFQREIAVYGRLHHPNLVRLIDTGEIGRFAVYIVLDFIEGYPLSEVLKREDRLGAFECKRLLSDCLDALSAGHVQGVVHRDFKPQNVMLTQTGSQRHAIVLDFGLAGATTAWQSMAGRRVTRPGEVAGTVAYLAPEQIQGEVTPQSDIYAWGLVYLECLTGWRVFTGDSAYEIVMKHMKEEVTIPEPIASHPLGTILRKATARELSDRYQSAAQVLDELRACSMCELENELEAAVEIPISELSPVAESKAHDKPAAAPLHSAVTRLYRSYLEMCQDQALPHPLSHEEFTAFLARDAEARAHTLKGDTVRYWIQLVNGEPRFFTSPPPDDVAKP
ncbi:MAG: serine/threonine-protein kinase [Myxococcota bacterium]|nr:serine/threonine-protein kinase [Myxococcota bacterium]